MTPPWQTRASQFHPFIITAVAELPDSLRPLVAAALPVGATMLSGVVFPADFRAPKPNEEARPVPAQALVFTGSGMLHVQAAGTDAPAPEPAYFEPADIIWFRSSHLLLYGRLEIAAAIRHEPVLLDLQFNAVGWRQRDQNWRNFVAQSVGMPPMPAAVPPAESEQDKAILRSAPPKFVDGLYRYGLYTGETLHDAIFQEAIWQHRLTAFDEQLAPDTLVAVTDASVLILAEEKAFVRDSDELGLIITRIPRRAVTGVRSEKGDRLDDVVFTLSGDGVTEEIRLALAPDAADNWLKIWSRS